MPTYFKTFVYPCLALGLLIAGCEEKKPAEKKTGPFCLSDSMQRMVTIDSARICSIDDELHLSGEVSFDENKIVKVFPNSTGQVAEVKVTLGDKVAAGQVLAVIKSADVAGNYNDLASAEADVKIAKRQLDNEESLFKSGLASQKEYEEAKLQYEKSMSSRNKIQSLISINGGGNMQAGGQYIIKSPISGYIVEKKVNAGSFIRQDMNDNMFTISDLKDVWVWANVYEADISKVKEGYNALVTTLAYPYGADNEFVRRVVADLGFRAAASCEPGISRIGDDPLRLRRIEISGGCAPEQLLTLIGRTSEQDLSDALSAH